MNVTTDHGVALRVSHVSKAFSVYPRPSDRIVELVTRRVRHRTIQALCDVSFTIKRGEVIGIIGRNGAGKSTLLKIIAGILDCDHGTVEAYGSLASILELGTGFHPDYSGRENIYIGGACLGMTRDEIERKIESIIEFSELHDFIDLPIKTYSSGMQARLTFSTAISIDPEIMVVDEALATGDLAFVEKCIRRIERIIQSGRTVLLVSHNMNLITRLTKRAIWLDQGKLMADDASETVAKQYELSMYRQANDEWAFSGEARLGDQKIRILDVGIEGQQMQDQVFLHGTDLIVHIEIEASIESETACFYLAVHRADGLCAWTATNYQHLDERYQPISTPFHIKPGRSRIGLRIAQCPLNAGSYGLDVGIEPVPNIATVGDYHDYFPRCRKFSIVRQDSLVLNKMCDSPSTWSIRSR